MAKLRPLALPLVLSLVALAILIGLGKWQLDRRDWKLALIERIESRAHGEAISLTKAKSFWQADGDIEYYRVLLLGRFLNAEERYLYTIVEGEAGWRVITPFETRGGHVVLVDRGFVPEALKNTSARQAGLIEAPVELTGLARSSEAPSWFTPDNQPAANRWFWRDLPGLAASLPAGLQQRTLPFMVEAEAMEVPGGWPRSGVTRLKLPNRHLEYALTWFGLAAALVAVFGIYARSRLREHRRAADDASIARHSGSL
ncbi:MAG: SURF1 family protein [Rhodomicrobium sp.]|nr:SURF1 family protein [Rhodomicrobium sp.]